MALGPRRLMPRTCDGTVRLGGGTARAAPDDGRVRARRSRMSEASAPGGYFAWRWAKSRIAIAMGERRQARLRGTAGGNPCTTDGWRGQTRIAANDALACGLHRGGVELQESDMTAMTNPNIDFYSGIIYKALGTRIARPRQIYTGATTRDYVGIETR